MLFHGNLDSLTTNLVYLKGSGRDGLRSYAINRLGRAYLLAVNLIEADFLVIVETRKRYDAIV